MNNIVKGIETAIDEINSFRFLSSSDGPLLGKEPDKLFPNVLIVFIDNLTPSIVDNLHDSLM